MRRQLVDAAIEQLAGHGMRDLTHRKVERRAGVAQGSAKYHFGSLGGLVEAVLQRMVEVELTSVMVVPPEVLAEADETGRIPDAIWEQARSVCAEILGRPALARARFELYLHAVGRSDLQDIIRRGRDQFVARTAAALRGQGPDPAGSGHPATDTRAADDTSTADHTEESESGARLILALVDGMVLHQLSAPGQAVGREAATLSTSSQVVDQMALHLVASAAAARSLPRLRSGHLGRSDHT